MRALFSFALLLVAGTSTPAQAQLIPRDFDWRDVGGTNYVSGVRNVNACSASYIFAATGIVESRQMIAVGRAR
jgi:hypothetical protein